MKKSEYNHKLQESELIMRLREIFNECELKLRSERIKKGIRAARV